MPIEPATMEIRPILPSEAGLLAAVAERFFRESFSLSNDARQMDAYCAAHFTEAAQQAELLDPRRDGFFATEHGRIIGFAQLCRNARPLTPIDVGSRPIELERFYVDRSYHGRGRAQQLMAHILEHARSHAADVIWLGVWQHNPRAIAFYRKCGFQVAGEQIFMLGTEAQPDYVMTRMLE